jgi:DNA topoisomerase IB
MTRQRCGKGFLYRRPDGVRLADKECLDRIRLLAIPPAWEDVWICPWPNGHIQATGTDSAGRRQYRYHDEWRRRRDQEKFDRAIEFGRLLPTLRRIVAADLARPGLTQRRVLAAGVRLMDVACFRIGGEEYAQENDTFGVATLQVRHATIRGDSIVFSYKAKGSIRRTVEVADPDILRTVRSLLRRQRRKSDDLLAWRSRGTWHNVRSEHLNSYIKKAIGPAFSAKDFRTWNATVLTAVRLSTDTEHERSSVASRRHAKTAAIAGTAELLGNTPAVCRKSYIDPRLFDCYESGDTVAPKLPSKTIAGSALQRRVELAVIALLDPPAKAA